MCGDYREGSIVEGPVTKQKEATVGYLPFQCHTEKYHLAW